jgi:curli biogenesis system outer membrane secretion channel CsgG
MDMILDEQELAMSGTIKTGTGARSGEILVLNAIVTGAVSQFLVKQKSATYLVGASKTQTAEATVDVRLIDATTGQVVYADSGNGVYEESSTQVLGVGGAKGYDETMEGKALRAAISRFIDNLLQRMEAMEWSGKVAGGNHKLELRLAGYETYRRDLYVSNSLLRIEATLVLAGSGAPGEGVTGPGGY